MLSWNSWYNPLDNVANVAKGVADTVGNTVGGFATGGQVGTRDTSSPTNDQYRYFENNQLSSTSPSSISTSVPQVQSWVDTNSSDSRLDYNLGGGGGGTSPSYSSQDLELLNQQKSLYERLLESINSAERTGLDQLTNSERAARNKANQQRSRQLEDFGVNRQDMTRGQEQALNTVGDNSRTLRGSLMRRLGLASGGGSAFQMADQAVARDASKNRQGVQETYGTNFRNLATSEERAEEDYGSLLDEILSDRRSKEQQLKAGILGQRQGISQSLAQIEADRASLLGGSQLSASQPYVNQYLGYQDAIDKLPSQYSTSVQARALNPQVPQLKDYIVNRSNIGGGQRQQQYSPYSQFLRPKGDEEEQLQVR